jgi:hypothetical protein
MSRQSFSNRATPKSSTPASTSTAVRNTSIPKAQPQASSRAVTHDMIAKRAYEISQSPQRGSDFDNWVRAERELRAGR